MKEFGELIEIRDEKQRLEEEIAKIQKPHLVSIEATVQAMKDDVAKESELLAEIQEREKSIREFLLDEWPEDVEKQYVDEGTGLKIARKTREKPEVHDLKAMMAQAVTFDVLPVKKVNWNNKDLKALISAGVVRPEVATLQKTFELAITYPKSE